MTLGYASASIRLAAGTVIAVTLLGACSVAPPSPSGSVVPISPSASAVPASPSPSVVPSAPSGSVVPIVLRTAPDNLGCDAVPTPWKFFVIHIDAFADDQVWAVNDQGGRMNTFWERGFIGGTSTNPVVLDPDGQVVVRDGERIDVPDAAWPELHGHFVCPSIDEIYILLAPAPG